MADGTATASSGAPAFSRVRLKPEVFQTIDGKIIVEDELLHFLAMKIRTLSQDEIVILATNCFDSDWIEASKKTLFELCPTTQQNVSHKGAQKDVNNIKSCLKVLNECGDNVPRFVSHYLDELPPVTFANLDVCTILRKVEQLHAEVSALKSVLHLQVEASDNLRSVVVDVTRRVTDLEMFADHGCTGQIASMRRPVVANASASPEKANDSPAAGTGSAAQGEQLNALSPVTVEVATSPVTSGLTTSHPESPKWTRIVRRGEQRRAVMTGATLGSRDTNLPTVPRQSGKAIIGTGSSGYIKVVKTKQCPADITVEGLHPEMYDHLLVKQEEKAEIPCIKQEVEPLTSYIKEEEQKDEISTFPLTVIVKSEEDEGPSDESGAAKPLTYSTVQHLTTKGEEQSQSDVFLAPFSDSNDVTAHPSNFITDGEDVDLGQNASKSSNKSSLKKDTKERVGGKPFTCLHCDKGFYWNADFEKHMRTHTGEKPFVCIFCGKGFTAKGTLNRHISIHTGEKPFACSLCDKRFSQKTHLEMHKRIHTGEKPFVCTSCGKRFTEKGTLNRHVATHTGEKPFDCPLCGKRFGQKRHLVTHVRSHTG
ncbi:zinc finger protein 184-like [Corythoichthys intestinalis]|uniref:zinc finger protein 184-like n=1 Tax=Corythoichthys intestinalis TaxID=161448 RepID=UPI0025A5A619|nr:zinc finger protein 184-like [Corythoichthys intestinalis]